METQRRLLRYVLVYKGRLILAALCGLGIAGCNIFMATLVNWFSATAQSSPPTDIYIVRLGVAAGWFTVDGARFALIWMVAGLLVAVQVPRAALGFLNAYLVASATNRMGTDVRGEMYAHVQSLPLRYFHKSRIGELMSRMNSDVAMIQQSSQVVMQAIDGPLMITVGLARMFMLSWKLSVLTIVFVPLMGIAIDRISRKIRGLTTTQQEKLADVSATIEETVRGVRIIKSFGMEAHEVARFDEVNRQSLTAALRAAKRSSVVLPAIELMGGIAVALIVLAGGWMVVHGQITFRVLTEFAYLGFMVAASAKQFGRLNVMYQQTVASGERIFHVLDTKSDMPEAQDAITLSNVQGKVEFEDVRFEYVDGETVLEGLSFTMEPGEVVAIVGPSGAGKSTIADLVLRFYDVTSGTLLVEDVDVRQIRLASLRQQIAMVPQETILFSGTIADNISYGKPGASIDEVIAAAKSANAHDFITQSPEGYDTRLGEGGVGLSGGQRQRISIARALLKDPKILILDEATSSLDAASEAIVQEALDYLMQGRSTLVIAHRLSSVRNANKILVVDRGRVIESGTFEQLVTAGGFFSELYKVQLNAAQSPDSVIPNDDGRNDNIRSEEHQQ